jgi:type VI secretion system VasD/TssJ family lipoprotein
MLSRSFLACLWIASFTLFAGCSAVNSTLGGNTEKEALAALEWSYGKEAIRLDLQADPKLNIFDGESHTLVIGLVQLEEPNAFTALLADSAAVGRLLESGRGLPGMLVMDRYVVEPGRTRTLIFDRAQRTQYVGIVAGYYELDPLRNTRLFKMPIDIKSSGYVTTTRTATPAPLRLRLVLGAQRITAAEVLTGRADDPAKPAPKPAPPPPAEKAPPAKLETKADPKTDVKPPAKPEPKAPAKGASGQIDLNTVRQSVETANTVRKLTQ